MQNTSLAVPMMMTMAQYLAMDDNGVPPTWGPKKALSMVLDDRKEANQEEDNTQKEKENKELVEVPLKMFVLFRGVLGAEAILLKYLQQVHIDVLTKLARWSLSIHGLR